MSEILRTARLDVGYEGKAVISGVEIEALRGQTICLIGPNGAGKSTILRTLSGMLAPVEGTVYIKGEDLRTVKTSALSRTMAVVLTEKRNMDMTTAYEVAAMGRMPYTGFFGRLEEADHRIIRECMSAVGAANLAKREYHSLSDGEKQKVMIARALAQEPELMILDEPTSHLDIRHKVEVVGILGRMAKERGMTVILALHDVDLAVKGCQYVLLVRDGEIAAQGRPEDIVQENTITDLYQISGASYNALLGCMELHNKNPISAFVSAGAGRGTPVYRALSRMGIGTATGILFENDVDCCIARSMQLRAVVQEPFTPIGEEKIAEAAGLIRRCRYVIDSGFPAGPYCQASLDLLREAKQVFTFRKPEECRELYGSASVCFVDSIARLQRELEA